MLLLLDLSWLQHIQLAARDDNYSSTNRKKSYILEETRSCTQAWLQRIALKTKTLVVSEEKQQPGNELPKAKLQLQFSQ